MKKKIAGINGFGRFTLHFLKYWLSKNSNSDFNINYINDETLDINRCYDIITNDNYVKFDEFKILKSNDKITFLDSKGVSFDILFTNDLIENLSWLGEPELFLECSGRYNSKKDCDNFANGSTKLVIISATAWDADQTLVYGFNHYKFNQSSRVISYGSCTVNAFVPLANIINKEFGILNSDANVIHNIQNYKLKNFNTLQRKFCTLERSGTLLLDFLNENNFKVNYTLIPFDGPSIIDYRFKLKKSIKIDDFITFFTNKLNEEHYQGLYKIINKDNGPEKTKFSSFSSEIIRENTKILNDNLYLFSYFDNENSGNRYFDLINYIAKRI